MTKNKTKIEKALPVFWILILLLVILLLAACTWLASITLTGTRQTLDEAFQWQSAHYDTSFYTAAEKETYTVESFDGYVLHAELLKNPEPTGKYILLSHGYTDNRMGSLKYAGMYLDLGFSCILYDLRGHGENEPDYTTYGIREGRDLAALAADTRERYGDLTQLGLHGESLGAASTIASLKYGPEVDFVVADCGFSDIENVLIEGYRNGNLPDFLFDLADLGAKLRYHVSLKAMRPIDSLDGNRIPILFMHGAEDSFIPPRNSEAMAARTAGYHELHLIAGAGHAESVLTDPETYREIVVRYLDAIGMTES